MGPGSELEKRHVALVAQRPSDFVEMRRAGEALGARGHKITFVYHPLHGAEHDNQVVLAQLGELERADWCLPSVILAPERSQPQRTGWLKQNIRRVLGDRPGRVLGPIRDAMSQWLLRVLYPLRIFLATKVVLGLYRKRLADYRKWLEATEPDILLLPEDVVGLVTPLTIRAGHDMNIPSLVLPYTIANQDEAFHGLRSRSDHALRDPFNWVVGKLFPRWVMRREGYSLLRLPGPYVLGQELTGTSPPDPWMMNSGFANRIAVENELMREYYLRAGIPDSKMEVVGAVSDDYLARFNRNKQQELARLRQELGLPGNLPLLLVGGCPNQLKGAPAFDFADYEAMVEHMLDCLEPLRSHYTILLRPHPNFTKLAGLFEGRDVPSTMTDTARLVAVSNVYIAFASATIRWAIACGIPTINYDVFHYDYSDYKQVPGVLNVTKPEEFRAAVSKVDPSSPEYAKLKAASAQERTRWASLDGQSVARIEALIERLCMEQPVPRSAE